MTLTFEFDLDRVKPANQLSKSRSFLSKVIVWMPRHTNRQIGTLDHWSR